MDFNNAAKDHADICAIADAHLEMLTEMFRSSSNPMTRATIRGRMKHALDTLNGGPPRNDAYTEVSSLDSHLADIRMIYRQVVSADQKRLVVDRVRHLLEDLEWGIPPMPDLSRPRLQPVRGGCMTYGNISSTIPVHRCVSSTPAVASPASKQALMRQMFEGNNDGYALSYTQPAVVAHSYVNFDFVCVENHAGSQTNQKGELAFTMTLEPDNGGFMVSINETRSPKIPVAKNANRLFQTHVALYQTFIKLVQADEHHELGLFLNACSEAGDDIDQHPYGIHTWTVIAVPNGVGWRNDYVNEKLNVTSTGPDALLSVIASLSDHGYSIQNGLVTALNFIAGPRSWDTHHELTEVAIDRWITLANDVASRDYSA